MLAISSEQDELANQWSTLSNIFNNRYTPTPFQHRIAVFFLFIVLHYLFILIGRKTICHIVHNYRSYFIEILTRDSYFNEHRTTSVLSPLHFGVGGFGIMTSGQVGSFLTNQTKDELVLN